jgi:hypothetical protein
MILLLYKRAGSEISIERFALLPGLLRQPGRRAFIDPNAKSARQF